MKKLLIQALCCLFGSLTTAAQDMKVVSFRQLENDLTANTRGTLKTDQNGETAALIKIQTPERGFTFDGGTLGIVATEEHEGEIWVYVPRRAQKLIVQHRDYGVLRDFVYPVPIAGGRTYEMLIDIGTGRYATVTSQVARADIYIDGELVGQSPVRKYLNYGRHTIRAVKDRYEGEQTATITTTADHDVSIVHVDMHDMSRFYGDVTVTVDNKADIFFGGKMVGSGEWKTQLREGNYTVETRKADSDPVKTTFTVQPRQQNNVRATPPTPHTGWLSIYTRPRNVQATYNGTHHMDLSETQTVPVGSYQMEFARKGYVTRQAEYTVRRNETTTDTVVLERIKYVKPLAFYFGGAYTVRSLSGVSAILGAVIKGHDVQASYTFGTTASDPINDVTQDDEDQSSFTYKMNSIAVKYGYQINLLEQLALTPQVGYSYDYLNCSVQNGSIKKADGAAAGCLTLGFKLMAVPFQHCYVFAAPEYAIALNKDADFSKVADAAGFSAGGFVVNLGVLINF